MTGEGGVCSSKFEVGGGSAGGGSRIGDNCKP